MKSDEYVKERGVDVSLRIFTAAETGAAHCRIENPSLGREYICDWIADTPKIDQRTRAGSRGWRSAARTESDDD